MITPITPTIVPIPAVATVQSTDTIDTQSAHYTACAALLLCCQSDAQTAAYCAKQRRTSSQPLDVTSLIDAPLVQPRPLRHQAFLHMADS